MLRVTHISCKERFFLKKKPEKLGIKSRHMHIITLVAVNALIIVKVIEVLLR